MNFEKKLLPFFFLLGCLVGCNSLGTKEELVARIGSEKIYLSDIELSQKLAHVQKNSTRFAEIFNEVILNEGMASLARTSYPGISALLDEDIKRMDTRFMTLVYQQFYIMEMLGYKQAELEKYYEANKNLFPLDSNQTFNDIREKVAKKLYLETHADSLERFIKVKLPEYATPAQADVYFFRSKTLKESSAIETAIRAKTALDSIQGNIHVNLNEKKSHELLQQEGIKPFIFGDSALTAQTSPRTFAAKSPSGDSVYYTIQIVSRQESQVPVLEEHLDEIQNQFIDIYKQDMIRASYNRFQEKYAIENQPISDSIAKKYYDDHVDQYKTLPGFSVYHIEHSDSALLKKEVLDQIASLDEFKQKATQLSQNTFTKQQAGLVGHIKKSHSLPYGIGLIPKLFDEFEGKPAGTISSILKAPNTDKYHVFYLEKEISSEQKSFDRVRPFVLEQLANDENIKLDSSFVLVTTNGKPLITEKDLIALRNEIPEMQRGSFKRSKLINLLTQWAVYALEAKSLDMDQTWEYKAFIRLTRRDIANQLFRDSLKQKEEFTEEKLKATYDQLGAILAPDQSYDNLRPLLKTYLKTPEIVLKREYYFNEGTYRSFADFNAARGRVFKNISSIEDKNQWKRLEKNMWSKYKVTVFNSQMPSLKTILSSDSLVLEAENLYKKRQLNEARANWELIRSIYPENEALFKKATFEIATIDNELEHYDNAESEYRVFYKLWPNDSDSEKALFSRAFVLTENLKQDSLALPLFKDFLVKYPKSELKESVEWLIQNIESNGKLAEELVKKISQSEEPTDSLGSMPEKKAE